MAIFQVFLLIYPHPICPYSLSYNFYFAFHRGRRILLCLIPDISIYLLGIRPHTGYET